MTLLLVAGMHRSGTSLLAQAVQAMGIEALGAEAHLPADRHSPRGYTEWVRMRDFNDRLLHSLGTNWLAPSNSAVELIAEVAAGPLGRQARAMVDREQNDNIAFVKDPRFCLTLPFWAQVFNGDVMVLASFRNPGPVATSLAKRDGIPAEYGVRLWQSYNDALRSSADGLASCGVWYDDLIDNPDATLTQIGDFIRTRFPLQPDAVANSRQAIDMSLRRSDAAAASVTVPDATAKIAELLRASAGGPIPQLDGPLELVDDTMTGLARFAGWRMDAERNASRARQQVERSIESKVAEAQVEALGLATAREQRKERAERGTDLERDRLQHRLDAAERRLRAIEDSRAFEVVRRYWVLADRVKSVPFIRKGR